MPGKKTKHGHKKAGKHHGGSKHKQAAMKVERHAHVVGARPTHVTAQRIGG